MTTFEGEHLIPGYLGQLFIIINFIASILSAYGYYKSTHFETIHQEASLDYKKLGRIGFYTQFISIVGIFITLFYIIFNHYFEYYYAWRHSSINLPIKYIMSSFWEGSEGSFLLWMFWQSFLSFFVISKNNVLESRTMTIVGVVQVVLASFVLGWHFTPSFHIGSSPFILLRHQMQDAPIFQASDYLSKIADGNGLNPLLQNYWMTIHPPVLFLGFATALFPFAYALAAIWKGDYKLFVKPAIRWSLATGGFLGLGIMMGGAWAYESLTFGGYWAWDPVENASLVPWLIMIAGLHTMLIFKATGRSLKISLIFLIITYIFVWYSTFLTRTGILGETSVHSFTDSGKSLYYHLLIILILFVGISVLGLIKRWNKMPKIAGEEELASRDFWMLIGSFALLLSSLLIIFYTSVPLWSSAWKMISNEEVAIDDPVSFYNKQQVWFAVVIGILSGAIQFLKYKKSESGKIIKVIGLLSIISALLTVVLVYAQDVKTVTLVAFGFSGIFAVVSSGFYFFSNQKAQLKKAGGTITHVAFGLMIIAILFSSYKKDIISIDRTGQVYDFGKDTYQENLRESRENVLLFRNTGYPMGDYMVTYLGDSVVDNEPPIRYFKLRFEKLDRTTGSLSETFHLYPNVFVNKKGKEGLGSNPDSRHYLTEDIFTYVTSTSDPDKKQEEANFRPFILKENDTIYLANGYLVYEGLSTNPNITGDVEAEAIAKLTAYDISGKLGTIQPKYTITKTKVINDNDTLNSFGIMAHIKKIDPVTETLELNVYQRGQQDDFIVIKVTRFPYIGLLWLSIALMFIGFMISLYAKRKK